MNITKQAPVHALRRAMRSTEQTTGMSVLEHGLEVARYFEDLRSHVINGTQLKYEWKLPDWVYDKGLWSRLLPLSTVRRYQIYHDVGKPFCRTVDEQGRVHFPNHAEVSAKVWLESTGEADVANLMAKDMDIHLLKGNGVEAFSACPEAATLLLTGLAEITANASMFGGVDSTSFKIKFKNLNRRGKAIVNKLNAE